MGDRYWTDNMEMISKREWIIMLNWLKNQTEQTKDTNNAKWLVNTFFANYNRKEISSSIVLQCCFRTLIQHLTNEARHDFFFKLWSEIYHYLILDKITPGI
jgi:hypothetical protein